MCNYKYINNVNTQLQKVVIQRGCLADVTQNWSPALGVNMSA